MALHGCRRAYACCCSLCTWERNGFHPDETRYGASAGAAAVPAIDGAQADAATGPAEVTLEAAPNASSESRSLTASAAPVVATAPTPQAGMVRSGEHLPAERPAAKARAPSPRAVGTLSACIQFAAGLGH